MTESEIRAIVKEELLSFFSAIFPIRNSDIEYLDTKGIAEYLGYKSVRPIYHLLSSGVLRVGKEVQDRRPPSSDRADYYFNKKACLKRLNELPEKRTI